MYDSSVMRPSERVIFWTALFATYCMSMRNAEPANAIVVITGLIRYYE
jgi:hypothetical protein